MVDLKILLELLVNEISISSACSLKKFTFLHRETPPTKFCFSAVRALESRCIFMHGFAFVFLRKCTKDVRVIIFSLLYCLLLGSSCFLQKVIFALYS